MVEIIFSIIFVLSFGGVLLILARKIPVLITLPQNGHHGIKKHHIILDIENKVKDFLLTLEKQIFLHKLLSWIKCLTIKIEVKVDNWLHSIRKKAQKIDKEQNEKK
ncbi:MAG: hypothetical protein A2401_02160 [Candidatus Staskawiczbacteria bacterium RIFOXYC1_FULL_38_18]|uniref:Uncharacterized protein n=1 Tax=Candidatus Staskawiczbacteria bacterium RIFOXYC1_FULL_38_18 TaxID=1802229 RepID=A0A1G2JER3_9BACT|nr:MAG: hypothetical protein A2401_02160 [Candidatus Staskawiczbacteria bacterium RIFOXYC1_FULL_38_18]